MEFTLFMTILGTGLGIIIAMGALVLTLFLWARSESNADRRDIANLIVAIKEDVSAIQIEMKDFHARLERQDFEFKTRLCAIEEKKHGVGG